MDELRVGKFKQAAFVYLHVGLLYEAAVWRMASHGMVSPARGPVWVWLLVGAAIVAGIFWALWFRRSIWTARVIWALHALRLPMLIDGAFLRDANATLPPSFYLTALVIVLLNLAMLARAGWDL